jgi:hypothetical protein
MVVLAAHFTRVREGPDWQATHGSTGCSGYLEVCGAKLYGQSRASAQPVAWLLYTTSVWQQRLTVYHCEQCSTRIRITDSCQRLCFARFRMRFVLGRRNTIKGLWLVRRPCIPSSFRSRPSGPAPSNNDHILRRSGAIFTRRLSHVSSKDVNDV